MSGNEKAALWQEAKDRKVEFAKTYQEYTVPELQQLLDQAPVEGVKTDLGELEDFLAGPEPEQVEAPLDVEPVDPPAPVPAPAPVPVVSEKDPNEMAGMRLNTQETDDDGKLKPIRIDEQGREWYQEEVLKAGYAKPRGRRVMTYLETGTEKQSVQNGEYIEEFEIAGKSAGHSAQVKITLPSYQTGIYKDPRYPFKIHTYNGNNGFDLEDVALYYGGVDRVPGEIKRIYVENDLCWDVRTTIRAIEAEFRHLQMTGRVR